jgi:hypothetical protein
MREWATSVITPLGRNHHDFHPLWNVQEGVTSVIPFLSSRILINHLLITKKKRKEKNLLKEKGYKLSTLGYILRVPIVKM